MGTAGSNLIKMVSNDAIRQFPVDSCSQIREHFNLKVIGEAAITKFAKKHASSRKPLSRFLEIARAANWRHFPDVRTSFPSADYAPLTGTIIFDVGGNKYRLTARADFGEQLLYIQDVLTHEEYDRENF
jgi:mRNA interferase HigB